MAHPEAIPSWLVATDQAIRALVIWRLTLDGWQQEPPNRGTVALALALLRRAGLGEWARRTGQTLAALGKVAGPGCNGDHPGTTEGPPPPGGGFQSWAAGPLDRRGSCAHTRPR